MLSFPALRGRFLAFLLMTTNLSQGAEDFERQKAAYLFQLARFITWPEFQHQLSFFTICLYKSETLKPILFEAQGRKVQGRPFKVMTLEDFDAIPSCQILFARHFDGKARLAMQQRIERIPVLFSSDMPGFTELGGTLELKHRGNDEIKIAINIDTATASGLIVRSNLMELAEIIRRPAEFTAHPNTMPTPEDDL